MTYEEPILNSPFDEPSRYWFIREGYEPELKEGRRPAIIYPPREGDIDWDLGKVQYAMYDWIKRCQAVD
jgi:type III restriction enzyme